MNSREVVGALVWIVENSFTTAVVYPPGTANQNGRWKSRRKETQQLLDFRLLFFRLHWRRAKKKKFSPLFLILFNRIFWYCVGVRECRRDSFSPQLWIVVCLDNGAQTLAAAQRRDEGPRGKLISDDSKESIARASRIGNYDSLLRSRG